MSKNLFDLIKTLSKAEKRVFSENMKNTKRLKYYKKLMNTYSQSPKYSDLLDNKIFAGKNKLFVNDCKRVFKENLCHHLVNLDKNKEFHYQVEQQLDISLMLFDRKLFNQSKKINEKIELIASKYEMHELLIKIKSHKIRIAMMEGLRVGEHDKAYMKLLFDDKKKALNRLLYYHTTLDDFHFTAIEQFFFNGLSKNKPGKKQLPEDMYKGISVKLSKLQKQISSHMMHAPDKILEDLVQILDLVDKNKKLVLKAKLLGLNYSIYLTNYIGLQDKSLINPNQFFKKYDEIKTNSIYEKCSILEDKTVAYCIYALGTYQPSFALPQLNKRIQYYEEHNVPPRKNIKVLSCYLYVYFALKCWSECLTYLDEIEVAGRSMFNESDVRIVKLICLYESGEVQYFQAVINTYMAKLTKKGISIDDHQNISDCLLVFLYYSNKKLTHKLNGLIRKIYQNFNYFDPLVSYLISWLICKNPSLHNDEYLQFLEKNDLQHYNFEP